MDSQPSSSSGSGRPQRKRKPNSKYDIEDTISIPIKSQRRKTTASSQNSTFWQKSSAKFLFCQDLAKSRYSEKHTNFEKIFRLRILSGRFFQTCVLSEYLNFSHKHISWFPSPPKTKPKSFFDSALASRAEFVHFGGNVNQRGP